MAFLLFFLVLSYTVAAAAATYDLNPDSFPPGSLPSEIGAEGGYAYITNTNVPTEAGEALDGIGTVDTLRVGQSAGLGIGFDAEKAANGRTGVGVLGDMRVAGQVRVGTFGRTADEPWLPAAGTTRASALDVGGELAVEEGGSVVIEGGSESAAAEGVEGAIIYHSGVSANRVNADGGSIRVGKMGELRAQAIGIRNGGRIIVDAGRPTYLDNEEMTGTPEVAIDPGTGEPAPGAAPEADWAFKGVWVGGGGIDVESGGVLAAGANGGVIDGGLDGVGGAAVRIGREGVLDVSEGDLLVRGIGQVRVDGTFIAGLDHQLTSEDGAVIFGAESKTSLSAELARSLNGASTPAALARGRRIEFEGGLPTLRTGMGFYTLGIEPFTNPLPDLPAEPEGEEITESDPTDPASEEPTDPAPVDPAPAESVTPESVSVRSGNGETLVVTQVERAVSGTGADPDREVFQRNLDEIWDSEVNSTQAKVMYDLLASGAPSIVASGETGEFNKAVLEALMNGEGSGIAGRGVADSGVRELYDGGAQWGANAAAYGTAELVMAGLDRRVHRIGAELDRQGHEEVIGYAAYPSLGIGEAAGGGRVWAGALYMDEETELDYGVSGYTYRPRGAMFGYDRSITGSGGVWTFGAAGAFATGAYDDSAASSDDSTIDSYSAGLFAAYHGDGGFNASAFATASGLENNLSDVRGGLRREADFASYAWSAGVRAGYDMLLTDRLMIQPSLGVTHVSATAMSHSESLGGASVLRVGDVSRNGTLVPVDVTLGYDLVRSFDSLLRLNVGFGYAYDFGDAPSGSLEYSGLVGAPAVDITSREPDRHRLNVGAGLLYTRERFDVTARYDYTRRSSQTVHQGSGSLGLKF